MSLNLRRSNVLYKHFDGKKPWKKIFENPKFAGGKSSELLNQYWFSKKFDFKYYYPPSFCAKNHSNEALHRVSNFFKDTFKGSHRVSKTHAQVTNLNGGGW